MKAGEKIEKFMLLPYYSFNNCDYDYVVRTSQSCYKIKKISIS